MSIWGRLWFLMFLWPNITQPSKKVHWATPFRRTSMVVDGNVRVFPADSGFRRNPIDVRRKGVGQWTFLLGSVRLGHRKEFTCVVFICFTCICCRVGFRKTQTFILLGWDTEIGRAIIGPIYI